MNRMTNREIARLIAIRHGYDDPAAIEFRRRARWDERKELAGEVFTVALWLGGGFLWMLLTWPSL
jgi:hypothetical protein